jgi:hypothetical protein
LRKGEIGNAYLKEDMILVCSAVRHSLSGSRYGAGKASLANMKFEDAISSSQKGGRIDEYQTVMEW